MSARPDKAKIIDEIWDDARIESFLDATALDPGEDIDHQLLLRAYQSMRAGDFQRFVARFADTGRALDAHNATGQSVAEFIQRHRHAAPYVEALVAAGARAPTAA